MSYIVHSIALWKHLGRLALPPPRRDGPRRALVPYCGSGSEMIAALRAGWEEVVGIEMKPRYVALAGSRLARWSRVPIEMDEATAIRRGAGA